MKFDMSEENKYTALVYILSIIIMVCAAFALIALGGCAPKIVKSNSELTLEGYKMRTTDIKDEIRVKEDVLAITKNRFEESSKKSAQETDEYFVLKGDCLWTIAKKKTIYGNPFMWPAIYRNNRDVLDDPNIIEIDQKLKIKKNLPDAEISSSENQAFKYKER
jgi:hypothetical protein